MTNGDLERLGGRRRASRRRLRTVGARVRVVAVCCSCADRTARSGGTSCCQRRLVRLALARRPGDVGAVGGAPLRDDDRRPRRARRRTTQLYHRSLVDGQELDAVGVASAATSGPRRPSSASARSARSTSSPATAPATSPSATGRRRLERPVRPRRPDDRRARRRRFAHREPARPLRARHRQRPLLPRAPQRPGTTWTLVDATPLSSSPGRHLGRARPRADLRPHRRRRCRSGRRRSPAGGLPTFGAWASLGPIALPPARRHARPVVTPTRSRGRAHAGPVQPAAPLITLAPTISYQFSAADEDHPPDRAQRDRGARGRDRQGHLPQGLLGEVLHGDQEEGRHGVAEVASSSAR